MLIKVCRELLAIDVPISSILYILGQWQYHYHVNTLSSLSSCKNLLILGDSNVPNVNCSTFNTHTQLSSSLCDIICSLEQLVDIPTLM